MAQKKRSRRGVHKTRTMVVPPQKLGQILVRQKVLNRKQMYEALEKQSREGGSLKQAVLALGFAGEDDIIGAVAADESLPISFISPSSVRKIDAAALQAVPREFASRNKVIPLQRAGNTLTVAMSDPFDAIVMENLRKTSGCSIIPMIAREGEIEEAVKQHYPKAPRVESRGGPGHAGPGAQAATAAGFEDAQAAVARQYEQELAQAETVHVEAGVNEDSAPIIRLSVQLVEDAHEKRASDIHIEPFENGTIVRFRVDGVLHVQMKLPLAAVRALVNRYKIMSNLDIAEQRLPQDGRIEFKRFSRKGLDVDLRVSTVPVAFGEKVVMRILDKKSAIVGLDGMGFSEGNLQLYRWAITQPYGMILHVGPTGSGKTTTLYAALSEINTPDRNIQTAEDPVEYMLQQINQTQMRHDIGLDFARALRAFLRQDPDIIMVGEIRDIETATIAVEAALTGHLLFSTLHTNDAVGTVVRLTEMGLEPFLVSSSLLLVCAQRLMRRLCTCREAYTPEEDEKKTIEYYGFETAGTFRARGCGECGGSGYRGRVGTHEILTMTPEIHDLTNKRPSDEELRKVAIDAGMIPIFQDAMGKVSQGITSYQEAIRVVRQR